MHQPRHRASSGCAQGAKGSTDVTYWPVAIRSGVAAAHALPRARDHASTTDGMADGVIYYDADGVERRQKAEVVVLACNGIGTPRLLLNSRSTHFPDGLANRSGLVGKNLMFHPVRAWSPGIFDEPLEGYKGPTGCCIMSQEFYETDRSRGFVRGYSFEMLRGIGPVATALLGDVDGPRCRGARTTTTPTRELFDRTAGMVAICEDLPEAAQPRHARPGARRLATASRRRRSTTGSSENSQRMLDARGRARHARCSRPRARRRRSPRRRCALAGWHLMGTARMGTRSRDVGRERVGPLPRRARTSSSSTAASS